MGRRVEKYDAVGAGTKTRYYYDNQRVLLEQEDTGSGFADKRYYVFGNYVDEVLLMRKDSSADFYYAHDHLYSPVALFIPSGVVWERYEYDAYGKAYVMSGTYGGRAYSYWGNPYYFTGQRQDYLDKVDNEYLLKIMYCRSRYYDTYTGRFLQQDPLGVMPDAQLPNRFAILNQYTDGASLYEYARSSPVLFVDPSGQVVVLVVCAGGAATLTAAEAAAAAFGVSVAVCLTMPDCRAAITDGLAEAVQGIVDGAKAVVRHAASCCKKVECSFTHHEPHHWWLQPRFGVPPWKKCYMNHTQIMCRIKGTGFKIRVQVPYGPCYKFIYGIPPITH
jgi:RHS repeat-associated protein